MPVPNPRDMNARTLCDVKTPHVPWKWAAGSRTVFFTRRETRFDIYWKRHWISPLYMLTIFSYFFLVDLKSQVDFRLLDGLLPFFPIPTFFSLIRNSSRLNICPNTFHHLELGLSLLLTPPGRLLNMCSAFLVPSFRLMWPIQFSLFILIRVTISMSSDRACNS